ncbi:dinuclear metal center protein, YbgI family [Congregibacter litoralis KT71]|uniref:GTP cyclohydrolase 1 type 2 homolog n=2 Tax=Congregibacter TaxID=393661 RepID=A4A5D7_9GAMM|nr:dinuclear metal center protein, YbgI family [Congregibacter litoralis KT71]
MPVALQDLVRHCDTTLESPRFRDYCPNGLQVEGRAQVVRLAAAVTANQSVLEAAIAWEADALIVHHGYFWRGEAPEVVGMKRRRLKTLLDSDMSLLAYHLPLDAHPVLGNNARWGQLLGFQDVEPLDREDPQSVGNIGKLASPMSLDAVAAQVQALTDREPLVIGDGQAAIEQVAWCTGAAQGYIDKAAAAGVQLYISGEISEPTVHTARELGIAYMAAGHHATERYGVQALAASLAERFDLEWSFIDCDNPV